MTKRIYLSGRQVKISASSMWLWRRALRIPLAMFIATLCVHISSTQAALINGGNQTGIIFTNTTADSYTFTANTGGNIVLRIGKTNFSPAPSLHCPNNAWLDSMPAGNGFFATGLAYRATNSGTFSVLVSSLGVGGTGTYGLHLAQ